MNQHTRDPKAWETRPENNLCLSTKNNYEMLMACALKKVCASVSRSRVRISSPPTALIERIQLLSQKTKKKLPSQREASLYSPVSFISVEKKNS